MSRKSTILILLVLGCRSNVANVRVTIEGQGEVVLLVADREEARCTTGDACRLETQNDVEVTFQAVPADGWFFEQWSGDCSGEEATLTREAGGREVTDEEVEDGYREGDTILECTAIFGSTTQATVEFHITGNGWIEDELGAVLCDQETTPCTQLYGVGTDASFRARPDDGWTFDGWSDACAAATGDICGLDMVAGNHVVGAAFSQAGPEMDGIATGTQHTTVLTTAGDRYITGGNANGEAGMGSTSEYFLQLVEAQDDLSWSLVGTGVGRSTLAVAAATGDLHAWGANADGQLGLGDQTDRGEPVDVGRSVIDAAIGPRHSCVIDTDGVVACAGFNFQGALGDGTTTDRSTYERIGVSGATDIAVGSSHSCAVYGGGKVSCWGGNAYGQLGRSGGETEPGDVAGIVDAVEVSAATSTTCVRHATGDVSCWGYNGDGNVGVGSSEVSFSTPQAVALPADAVQVVVGQFSTYVVLADGSLYVFGGNLYGEFGDGTKTASDVPVLSLAEDVTSLAAGGGHACATTTDGALCWGRNDAGQLGDGTFTDRLTPVPLVLP